MNYMYSIKCINEKERMIFLSSNDEWDFEESDAFVFLLKKIKDKVRGHVLEVDRMCYQIPEDGLGLYYQWDTLLGITIVYPQIINLESVVDFLRASNLLQ